MSFRKKESLNKRLEPSEGVLYVVGTPIGNLGDLSPRAKSVLKEVSIIACEDTRHSGHLIRKLECKSPLFSFFSHNSQKRIPKLISFLKEGKSIALISDAGMPSISDPGEALVASAREEGIEVIAIPGACAAVTALACSGLNARRFCFEGFIPYKGKDRKERLKLISKEIRTTIIYESPHRLIQLLKDLKSLCSKERRIHIARELTKIHEQHLSMTIESALEYFLGNKPIGEFTIILEGDSLEQKSSYSQTDLLKEMQYLISNGKTASDAVKIIANETGESRRMLYNLLHNIQKSKDNV